jgi:hypothetical protein
MTVARSGCVLVMSQMKSLSVPELQDLLCISLSVEYKPHFRFPFLKDPVTCPSSACEAVSRLLLARIFLQSEH